MKLGRWALGVASVLCALSCAPPEGGEAVDELALPAPVVRPFPEVPGVVVDYSPSVSHAFVGSPSLAVLPDGTYVASHDVFGSGHGSGSTHLFTSADRGRSWQPLVTLDGQFWSTLFVHQGALYLMGTSGEYGHVAIRRSRDGGKTWTVPLDGTTGLLRTDGKFHSAPVPVIEHGGRLWRAMELQTDPVQWPQGFRAFVMSAPVQADLLHASSWTSSEPLSGNTRWLGGQFNGWLEGNVVVAPGGALVDVLRVDSGRLHEMAAVVRLGAGGTLLDFDPATGFVPFPGGSKKFTIRFDRRSKLYWSLTNYVPPELAAGLPRDVRNTLALVSSPDLVDWTVRSIVLHHPDAAKHAFQYADWLFDGDDLIAVSRTAFNDGTCAADSFHNANFLTFHRIPRFRDTVPGLEHLEACRWSRQHKDATWRDGLDGAGSEAPCGDEGDEADAAGFHPQ